MKVNNKYSGGIIIALIIIVFSILLAGKTEASVNEDKYALIAISHIEGTNHAEYEKATAFYQYLIGEGYLDSNIYFYGPSEIPHTDGQANILNIEAGFIALGEYSTSSEDVVIYISDHGILENQIYNLVFLDGTVDKTTMSSWLDAIPCSEMTVIVNGNRSGLAGEFADDNRIIISSMTENQGCWPDQFNITRSLEDNSSDINEDGNISYYEAFNHECEILVALQADQDPQIWTD